MQMYYPSPPRPPKRYWRDSDWFHENYSSLVEQYPNQWVAVYSGKIISHSNSLGQVLDELEAQDVEFPVIGFVEKWIHIYNLLPGLNDELRRQWESVAGC